MTLTFFVLVLILGASNHVFFFSAHGSAASVPGSTSSGKIGTLPPADLVLTYQGRASEESKSRPLENPSVSGGAKEITPLRKRPRRVNEQQQTPLPLWRALVDCPVGSAALCVSAAYENSDVLWAQEGAGCRAYGGPSWVTPDALDRLHAARVQLRAQLKPGATHAASPLTGYRVHGTTRGEQTSPAASQLGCGPGRGAMSLEDQVSQVVAKWRQGKKTGVGPKRTRADSASENIIGFTMTDAKYADLLEEHLWTARNTVGLDFFFVVAYDASARAHACGLGADVVDASGLSRNSSESGRGGARTVKGLSREMLGKSPERDRLRAATTKAKFVVALALARAKANFVFWESDVFLLRRPWQLFRWLSDPAIDLVVSAHQYSPQEPNIGVFGAKGNEKTALVFENTIKWTALDTKLHDQRAFCLVARLCLNKDHRQSPVDVPLPAGLRVGVKLLGSHDVAASVTPRVLPGESFAIHVLSTTPLQSPAGKSYLSRELRAHPPTDRWFTTAPSATTGARPEANPILKDERKRCPGPTRVLAVEGSLSISRDPGYHCTECLRWTLSWLAALALVSGRTLVLPAVLFDFDLQFAAIYLDLDSLSRIVPWRETSFLSDPRFLRRLEFCHEEDGMVPPSPPSPGNASASSPAGRSGEGSQSSSSESPQRYDAKEYDNPWPFTSVARVAVERAGASNPRVTVRASSVSPRQPSSSTISTPACVWGEGRAATEDLLLTALAPGGAAAEAEAVFVRLSDLHTPLRAFGGAAKDGLVADVFKALRW